MSSYLDSSLIDNGNVVTWKRNDVKRDEWGVIWSITPESRTQESLHKVLTTLNEELEFLLVMVREQVPKGGLLNVHERS